MNGQTKIITKQFPAIFIIAVLCLSFAPPGLAFDTGHHADLTQAAMIDEGFTAVKPAVKVAALQNWLVDFYSSLEKLNSIPELAGDEKWKIKINNLRQLGHEVSFLHFDNLETPAQISNYWANLTNNMKSEVQQTAREIKASGSSAGKQQKILKMLTLIGISLHAVQDFYTHSNWVESFPRTGSYRNNTWFDTPLNKIPEKLRTGFYPERVCPIDPTDPAKKRKIQCNHGEDYTSGMNHDSYCRQNFPEAYVFAYLASRQWLAAVRGWTTEIEPGLWNQIINFSLTEDEIKALRLDLLYSYKLSEWLKIPLVSQKDGAWKGPGSGSAIEFANALGNWALLDDSIFVEQFKTGHAHRRLITGLTKNPIPKTQLTAKVPPGNFNLKVVELRTLSVASNYGDLDPFGGLADFYANITVDNQTFVEAMQLDQNAVSLHWHTLKFVSNNTSSVKINYELMDEDGGLFLGDDLADIFPGFGYRLDFNFDLQTMNLSGDISGIYNNGSRVKTVVGNGSDSATIKFFVTANSIGQ